MSFPINFMAKAVASAQAAMADAKSASTIATVTTGISLAQIMGWLQGNVGFIGALMGIVLTAVTIKVQWTNGRKAEIELEILRRKLTEE